NRTVSKMTHVFGAAWDQFTPAAQQEIVELWLAPEIEDDKLQCLGRERYGLTDAEALAWAQAEPEDGYAKLSLKALSQLLPLMESGMAFKAAEKELYGTTFSGGEAKAQLEPVRRALPAVANPSVNRALTELRKLVNALVREYGK